MGFWTHNLSHVLSFVMLKHTHYAKDSELMLYVKGPELMSYMTTIYPGMDIND